MSARPTIIDHRCPECTTSPIWVTFRSHATATLFCPECQHAWVEEVHANPSLQPLPLTFNPQRPR